MKPTLIAVIENPQRRQSLVAIWPSSLPGVEFHQILKSDDGFLGAMGRHYPGSKGAPPSKNIIWAVVEDGMLRGYIGLADPSFKLAARRRLGIADARPLPGTASVFMYRLEAPGRYRASEILDVWHEVAQAAWRQKYPRQPALVHFESMVDPAEVKSEVPGASFRKAGYRSIGDTTGRTARRVPAGEHRDANGWSGKRVWGDGTPKLVFYRGPLARLPANEVPEVKDMRRGSK